MSPKDIQTRIRAGATPAELAEETGVPLDRIERFAGPPLAERAWAADQARATVMRRDNGDETLDDIVAAAARSGDVDWDAWRRDDGRWTVIAVYRDGSSDQRATWVFDPRSRSVHADDDDARGLGAPDKVVPLRSRTSAHQTVVVEREITIEEVEIDEASVTEITAMREEEPPAKGRKGRRASVPSWDEILFGAGQPDN